MSPSTTAFREALKATATGSMTVLLSTVASCGFAVAIETGAHRLQYHLFPHWYDGKVKYAMGLPHLQYQQLDSEVKVQAQAEEKAKSHFETRVKGDAKGSEEGSMMCMFVGGDKSTNRTDTFECNHCGKNRHTAYCEGNHFAEHLLLD